MLHIIRSVLQVTTDVTAASIRGICIGVPFSYAPFLIWFLPSSSVWLGDPTGSNATAQLCKDLWLYVCAVLKRLATPSYFHIPLPSIVPFAHS
jgi:hypothetical protein